MVNCKTLRKKMKGGSSVEPELSGYRLNEGNGGLNDPLANIESSRLIKGGKKPRTKKPRTKKTRTKKTRTKKRKSRLLKKNL